MRTFYCILIVTAALTSWFPYDMGSVSSMAIVDALLAPPAAVGAGVAAALPFFLIGLVGQTALPPARRALPRLPVSALAALVIAVAVDSVGHALGMQSAGLLAWQLVAAGVGIGIALIPFVRRRLELGWLDGAAAAAAMLVLYILYRLYPYGFDFDPYSVSENLKPMIKFLVFSPSDFARELAGWLLVAAMLARIGPERFSSFVLLAFASVLIAAEVHVAGNTVSVSDGAALLTAFLLHGFILGWLPGRGAIYGLLIFALVAVVGLELSGLAVPTMRTQPIGIEPRPFVTLLQDSGEMATALGMFWVFLFAGVVWLFRSAGFGSIGAGAVAVVAFAGLEALRLFLDGRGPDPAAPLVACLAAISLAGLNRRLWRRWRPEEAKGEASPRAATAVAPAAATAAIPAAVAAAPAVYADPEPDDADEPDEPDDLDDDYDDYDVSDAEATPNWAMESGGGELAYDDSGVDASQASASGYVPEEVIEEEIEEYDYDENDDPDVEEDWRDEEEWRDEAWTEEDHATEEGHTDANSGEALPAAAPGQEPVDEDGDGAEAAASLSVSDIVFSLLRLLIGVVLAGGLSVGLQAVIGPSELVPALLRDASMSELVLFAVLLVIIGIAAAGIGRFAATTRMPLLTLPALSALVSVVLLILVDGILGEAWLKAIVGQPSIFNGVIHSSYGGDLGRALVNSLPNKAAFDALELLLRGTAVLMLLLLPMSAFMAAFMRMSDYPDIRGGARIALAAVVFAVFVGSALPWLFAIEFVIFNPPRDGGLVAQVRMGIGPYLLLVLSLVIGWNAALLARPLQNGLLAGIVLRTIATGLALAIGFVLAAFSFEAGNGRPGLNGLLAAPGAPVWQVAVIWGCVQLLLTALFGFGGRVLPARVRGATVDATRKDDREDA